MSHHEDSRAGVAGDVVPCLDKGLAAVGNLDASRSRRIRRAVVANDVSNDLRVAGLLDLDSSRAVPDDGAADQLEGTRVEGKDPGTAVVLDGISKNVAKRGVKDIYAISAVVLDRIAAVSLKPAGFRYADTGTTVVLHHIREELQGRLLSYDYARTAVVLDCGELYLDF